MCGEGRTVGKVGVAVSAARQGDTGLSKRDHAKGDETDNQPAATCVSQTETAERRQRTSPKPAPAKRQHGSMTRADAAAVTPLSARSAQSRCTAWPAAKRTSVIIPAGRTSVVGTRWVTASQAATAAKADAQTTKSGSFLSGSAVPG